MREFGKEHRVAREAEITNVANVYKPVEADKYELCMHEFIICDKEGYSFDTLILELLLDLLKFSIA